MAITMINESELSVMNAQSMCDSVTDTISRMVEMGIPARAVPPFMMWGAPGVGKSQCVAQAAENIGRRTGKRVVMTDVRLILFSPVDLNGVPVPDIENKVAIWLRPSIFNMDPSDDVINILFLDEITAVPQSVQAAAYQLVLDRKVGEHHLPDNCVVIAAGNRVTDHAVSYRMSSALANRLCHMELECDASAWVKWAMNNGVDMSIVGYLSYSPGSLMANDFGDDKKAFPTPRSWAMADMFIKLYGSVEDAFPYIVGCVGREAASSLLNWVKVWHKLPDVSAIFNEGKADLPTRPDLLYALVSQMVEFARRETTTISQIRRSVAVGTRLPADYAMLLFRGYLLIRGKGSDDIRSELLKEPEFRKWLTKHERYLDV